MQQRRSCKERLDECHRAKRSKCFVGDAAEIKARMTGKQTVDIATYLSQPQFCPIFKKCFTCMVFKFLPTLGTY